jgi:eukaryotic-like serine/threonine-protein kinase
MSLVAGTRLGPYEILTELGAGGMGEVYRARDTRLERAVAVKILPSRLSSDPAHKQRFEREAKAISHLNHPHICVLYDIGHQDGIDYLVMECVEGETLAKRLEKGPLPLQQVLKFGAQIADALDKAHRSGIIHRDLKPGNIILTPSGAKLLDFGLAKPVAPLASLATLTATKQDSPVTELGTIVGTFQYMSPEQIEGKELDGRSDIFSLGAVLYEMVTGKRAFEGKSQLSVASAILEKEPTPISSDRPMTPPALDHAIRRCLAKDPDDRWQTARDLTLELKWVSETRSSALPVAAAGTSRGSRARLLRVASYTLVFVILAAGLVLVGYLLKPIPAGMPFRASIPPPPDGAFTHASSTAGSMAISPDGRLLAFTAEAKGSVSQLWVRPLDSLESRPLAGTEYAFAPFWSPDSKWIAFFSTAGKLKKVEASGGAVETICDAPFGRGGAWNRDGLIVFTPSVAQPLFRVSASGGVPTPITQLDTARQENTHRWPQFLPDGKHYLFFIRAGAASVTGTYVGELGSPARRLIVSGLTNALYSPPGYLLFGHGDTLIAQPFDTLRMHLEGEPAPVTQGVSLMPSANFLSFSASQTGALIYSTVEFPIGRQLSWYDRQGKLLSKLGAQEYSTWPQLSPDGKRLVIRLTTPPTGGFDIWVYDLARGVRARMSFNSSPAFAPVWAPNGTQIAYAHSVPQVGGDHLFLLNSDGTGNEQPLEQPFIEAISNYPSSWSPDGHFLLFDHQNKSGKISVWVLPLKPAGKPYAYVETQFNAQMAQFSPDGHWVAYVSNDSGRDEVYIAPFPGPGGRIQVSSGGGSQPRWRHDGRELFYLTPDTKMMAAQLSATGGELQVKAVRSLFAITLGGITGFLYDVAPDGQRFIVSQDFEHSSTIPFTIVTNWPAEVKK